MRIINYGIGSELYNLYERHAKSIIRGLTLKKAANLLMFLYEYKTKKLNLRTRPFYIKIEPTNVCDHKCVGCGSLTPRRKGFMDYEMFKDIIDFFAPHCAKNVLYGQGESFLHEDIFKMIRYSENLKCPVTVSTHFNCFDRNRLQTLLDAGLTHIIVCVDGDSEESHSKFRVGGSLKTVLGNLEMLSSLKAKGGYRRPILEVQTIVFGYNKREIGNISKMVRDRGAEVYSIRKDILGPIEPNRNPKCPYLWGSVFFSWDGRMSPCEGGYMDDDHFYFTFDEIRAGVDFWNDPRMVTGRTVVKHGPDNVKATGIRCDDCFYSKTQ
jgi:hypothetical protein